MMNLPSVLNGAPIPTVEANDVKRVWSLMSLSMAEMRADQSGTQTAAPTMGFSQSLLAQQCSSGADVLAVYLRASLISMLLQQGFLEEWHEGNELREPVFWGASTFPLPNGLNNFNPDEFVTRLKAYRGVSEGHQRF
jgi:hypothetical protein